MKLHWLPRCALYFVIAMMISPFYDGWSSTAKYLISEGVFAGRCTKGYEIRRLYYLKPVCDDQAYEVGRLLSFYRISEFLSSILIGVFMDNCGPKLTVLMAIILRVVSWLMIPRFPNVRGAIILSCIMAGITSNGVAFPVFTIAQYSKKYYNATMAAISVSLCFGTFYTFVLNEIKYALSDFSPRNIIRVKLLVTHLPLFALSLFIFPNSLADDVALNARDDPPKVEDAPDVELSAGAAAGDGLDIGVALQTPKWRFKEFVAIIVRSDIVVISAASMVNVVSLTYAQESFPIAYGDNKVALTVNEVFIPLSFVFSVASVFFLERFGSVPIIVALNAVGALVHASMFFTNTAISVVTSVLMSMSYSLFMTQYYLYLDRQVPLTYQGSVKGFLVTSIGFTLFLNLGFNHLSKAYFYTRAIHIGIFVLRLVVTVPLVMFLRRSRGRENSELSP